MAFSPFHAFRKHKKIFFAGLTILCMVTFVMCGSMGQGDFFQPLLALFGGGRYRAQVVATLYGKDIPAQELRQLRIQRQMANQYMDSATFTAGEQVMRTVSEASDNDKWQESQRSVVRQVLSFRQFVLKNPQFRQQYLQGLRSQQGIIAQLEQLHADFARNKKTAEAGLIQDFVKALFQDAVLMNRPRNELYFGGTTITADDLLDFMIWRYEADRRGIQLGREEISELVRRETDNRLSRADQEKIAKGILQGHREVTVEDVRTALADEFRVRIVKSVLLGDDRATLGASTTWATPYEFWNFYRENRTENQVAVLPIPARNKDFLSQVGQPSEQELKDLFEKNKDREYTAGSDQPGFKVPPRIEVEWVNAKPDSEHYRQQAVQAAGLIQAGYQVLVGVGSHTTGAVAADATQTSLPFVLDTSLINEYELERYKLKNASWTDPWNYRLHESSLRRPENVAAALGQALGAAGTHAPAISSLLTFNGSALLREAHDRATIGTTMILAGSSPTPVDAAAGVTYGTPRQEFIPMEEVKSQLVEKIQEDLARELVKSDLSNLEKELRIASTETPEARRKLEAVNRPEVIAATLGQALGNAGTGARMEFGAPTILGGEAISHYVRARGREAVATLFAGPNPTPFIASNLIPLEKIRKTIDEAVARNGFQHGFTTKARDPLNIGEDEGLQPLKDAHQHYRFTDPQAKNFASLFFRAGIPAYYPQEWPQGDLMYQNNPFVYWKTGDKPAYVPPLEEAKDRVVDWWKLTKARELAKKEALDLKAKAEGQPDAERWLKDGTKHSEPMFLFDDVARLVKPRQPVQTSFFSTYQPFAIPRDKIEFPPDKLAEDLLTLDKPGEVIVRSDQPQAIYYVIALVKRTVPSEDKFYHEYTFGAPALFTEMDKVTDETGKQSDYRAEYRRRLMQQLRDEARWHINEDRRHLVEPSSRSDE